MSFSYDANGNLISDGLRAYTWDADNRLVSVASINEPNKRTAFRYDGLGRRVAILVSEEDDDQRETRYLWCGDVLCQARNSRGIVSRHYYPEGELSSGRALYYAQDQLGSVRDVLGAQTGHTVAYYDYDPYGNPVHTSEGTQADFRYAGVFYEQGSGLYLTRYWAYDPRTARWLSRDPIGERGGANLYAYAAEDPIKNVDRLGLDAAAFGGSCSANPAAPPPPVPPIPPISPTFPNPLSSGPTIGPAPPFQPPPGPEPPEVCPFHNAQGECESPEPVEPPEIEID